MTSCARVGNPVSVRRHDTPLGEMWSWWTPLGLYRLAWSVPEDAGFGGAARAEPAGGDQRQMARFDDQLRRYFDSGEDCLAQVRVDASGWSKFTRRVYRYCREIPASQTRTYQQLAAAAGSSRASRAVGAAMARNRVPLVIPCHRVVAAGGALRGFSAPGGLETKQRLLQLERNGQWAACG